MEASSSAMSSTSTATATRPSTKRKTTGSSSGFSKKRKVSDADVIYTEATPVHSVPNSSHPPTSTYTRPQAQPRWSSTEAVNYSGSTGPPQIMYTPYMYKQVNADGASWDRQQADVTRLEHEQRLAAPLAVDHPNHAQLPDRPESRLAQPGGQMQRSHPGQAQAGMTVNPQERAESLY